MKQNEREIPVGIGTSFGVLGTTACTIVALFSAVLSGDHTTETVSALVGAVFILCVTIAGRFAQAYAIYRDKPNAKMIADILDELTAPEGAPPPLDPIPPVASPVRKTTKQGKGRKNL